MYNDLTEFRNGFLDKAKARLLAFDPATATETDIVMAHALVRAYQTVAGFDAITAGAISEIGRMTGTQLDAYLQDASNAESFEQIMLAPASRNAIIANTAVLNVIFASQRAATILLSSPDAVAAITSSAAAMTQLAASANAMSASLGSSTALTAIFANPAALAIWKASTALPVASVPTMTSATTPAGIVTARAFPDSSGAPYLAFDKNGTTAWKSVWGDALNNWVGYQFTAPIFIHTVSVRGGDLTGEGTGTAAKNVRIEHSDNGVDWTVIATRTLDYISAEQKIDVKGVRKKYWRIFIENNYGHMNRTVLFEVNFIGFAQ